VLLAIVLIVALVSVALLGFFPGMASDSQIAQSQMYWKSATPVAIVESGARVYNGNAVTYPYLRIRNTGTYPIRLTGVVGGDNEKATQVYGGGWFTWNSCGLNFSGSISDYYYMGPGEEKYFGVSLLYGLPCDRFLRAFTGTASSGYDVRGASSICQNSSASPGTLSYKSFGFEYIEYIDGQQITKRQIGKDLIIKCREPY